MYISLSHTQGKFLSTGNNTIGLLECYIRNSNNDLKSEVV